jgi:ubiquinone/menaquinone biosynthesis C-methylase UbiE
MRAETVDLLCDPVSHEALRVGSSKDGASFLENVVTGKRYPIRDGIPVLLAEGDVTGSNERHRLMYDRIAIVYDLAMGLYASVRSGGEKRRRMEYLKEMEIDPGDNVLEVSVGTGGNLRYLPPGARYYGLDLSWGMLRQCRRRLRRWNLEAELFQGAAEHLPFRDRVFDGVLHMGGINFFNDIPQALGEMVRVAKPGTRIVIVDETEKVADRFQGVPVAGSIYADRREAIAPPAKMLPPGMQDVRVRELWNGELYCLTFRTP